MSVRTIAGWHPADEKPPTENEGESDYSMVLCAESSAPVVAWFNRFDNQWTPAIRSDFARLNISWWRRLKPIPVSILPQDGFRRELALNMNLAYDDTRKGDAPDEESE